MNLLSLVIIIIFCIFFKLLVFKFFKLKQYKINFILTILTSLILSIFLINLNLLNNIFHTLILLFSICVLAFLIFNFNIIKILYNKSKYSKIILVFLLLFMISTFIEFFIFNYNSIISSRYHIYDPKDKLNIISKTNILDDELYEFSDDNLIIEYNDINQKINNIYVPIDKENNNGSVIKLKIEARDDGNELYYQLPERTIYSKELKSHYIKLNLYGNMKSLKLDFKVTNGSNTKFHKVLFNVPVPLEINIFRYVFTFIFLFLIYLIRPSSKIYSIKCTDKFKGKYAIIILTLITFCLCFCYIARLKPEYINNVPIDQYQKLSNSIFKGHPYLDDKPSEILSSMNNPYDYKLREKVGAKGIWDHAYYKGKYYSYFGIVPVIIFYIPCYYIFHHYPPMYLVVLLTVIISCITFCLLLYQLIKKYFSKTSYVTFLLLLILFISSYGSIFFIRTPNIYFLPISSAIMFSLLGLYFWICSIKSKKINFTYVFLGSLSMALVAGCRPQLLLSSFLLVPIYYDKIKFKKENLKNNLKFLFNLLLPFLIIGISLMYYNYIRFNSPFDFGANYNLTTNDMTRRGITLGRIFPGIFYLLFLPFSFNCSFPFFNQQWINTNYMGITISEPVTSGALFATPLLIFGFLTFIFRKCFTNKKMYSISLMLLIFSIIILVFDVEMAGILQRYILDFNWMLLISSIITILSIENNLKNIKIKNLIKIILIFGILLSLIYNFLNIFISEFMYVGLIESNPQVFWKFYYLFHFWL